MSVSRRALLSALPALAATSALPSRDAAASVGLTRDEAVELFFAIHCMTPTGWRYSTTTSGPTEFDASGRPISYNVREAPFVELILRLCGDRPS